MYNYQMFNEASPSSIWTYTGRIAQVSKHFDDILRRIWRTLIMNWWIICEGTWCREWGMRCVTGGIKVPSFTGEIFSLTGLWAVATSTAARNSADAYL